MFLELHRYIIATISNRKSIHFIRNSSKCSGMSLIPEHFERKEEVIKYEEKMLEENSSGNADDGNDVDSIINSGICRY